MDSIDLVDKLLEIQHFLAEKEAETEPPYWSTDSGLTYCRECMFSWFTIEPVYGDDYDGGFCCECDSPEFCDKCGKVLDYTLTDYGVETELDHYEESPPDLRSPVECFMVSRVAHGITWDDEEKIRRLIAVMDTTQK